MSAAAVQSCLLAGKSLSSHPLSFVDAIRGLAKVGPKQLPASVKRRMVKKKVAVQKMAKKKG